MAYSDDFKAQAIALFETEVGKEGTSDNAAAKRVAIAMNKKHGTKLTGRTLVRWCREGKHVSPEVRKTVEEKKRDLQDVLEEIVSHAAGAQIDFIQKLRDNKHLTPDILIEAIKTLAVVTGISVEKIQLLRGEPTGINEQRGGINIFQQINPQQQAGK